eukprot:scaffold18828_cov14-Tisochrysis_lutea.AAC.1
MRRRGQQAQEARCDTQVGTPFTFKAGLMLTLLTFCVEFSGPQYRHGTPGIHKAQTSEHHCNLPLAQTVLQLNIL